MWLLKRAIDPKGLMNPGKVLPDLPTHRPNITSNTINSNSNLNISTTDKSLSITLQYGIPSKL